MRVRDKEWNEMQPNATELKVPSLLATPDGANQGHNQGQLAHRVRVSGVGGLIFSLAARSKRGPNRAK